METATLFARLSTCSRAQVGVVIARDGRVISTGYNGAPAGMAHCDHACDCGDIDSDNGKHWPACRKLAPCTTSIHAEANAIVYAARHGVNVKDATLFTTVSPCMACAQLIVAAGVTRVWFLGGYRDMSGVRFLEYAKVPVDAWPQTA
jgi:dCMP deaminase